MSFLFLSSGNNISIGLSIWIECCCVDAVKYCFHGVRTGENVLERMFRSLLPLLGIKSVDIF